MNADLIYPEQIDRFLNWSLGTAARMARRQRLPHYRLPDGSIRFRKDEIEALVERIPSRGSDSNGAKNNELGPRLRSFRVSPSRNSSSLA